jgi:nucleoside phosphorylase
MHPPSAPIPQVPVDVLVLAAHAPEFVGLRPHIGDSLNGVIANRMVVAKTIGVGLAVAGGATANRINQIAPRVVIALGSCGIYPGPNEYRPLDIVVPSRLSLFDPAVAAGKAAFPDPMQTLLDPDPQLSAALLQAVTTRGHACNVATTMSITTDDAIARAVHGATGIEAENLELFPIALACRAADIPFAAVLGVTNIVGSTGRQDWRQYQREAAVAAAEVIVGWLRGGGPGLPRAGTHA